MVKTAGLILSLCLTADSLAEQIVINEIMYDSPGTDVEFVELYNNSSSPVDLGGWYILDDNDSHAPCHLEGIVQAGGYLVIAADAAVFSSLYPAVTCLNSNEFDPSGNGWSLGNGGDAVRLFTAAGSLLDEVFYGDGGLWPDSADGLGSSLELIHPDRDNSVPSSWAASSLTGGTPGQRNSRFGEDSFPVCRNGFRSISLPSSGEEVVITVIAFDYEGLAHVDLFLDTGDGFSPISMRDDGGGFDPLAGDSVFTAVVPPHSSGTLVRYYALATDLAGQHEAWPNDAPDEYRAYTVDYVPPLIRLNEALPLNENGINDEYGEKEDWLEIWNSKEEPVNLEGMFLSDDLDESRKFRLPNLTLSPGSFLLVYADEDTDQGNLHANFKLSADGETVALFDTEDHGNVLISGWRYGPVRKNISVGFPTNSSNSPEYLSIPTPGEDNSTSPLFSPVCINEFLCTSAFGGLDDWIEVYNRDNITWDISGWFLSDRRSTPARWAFPDNTFLEPGEFLTVYEDELGFGLDADGSDIVLLSAPDSNGMDFFDHGIQNPDVSQGRYPDGIPSWCFFTEPTPNAPNLGQTNAVNSESVPLEFRLDQNYPNPFNPYTFINFTLSRPAKINVSIYTILGKKIVTLADGIHSAGQHRIRWDASHCASGIYICRLSVFEYGNESSHFSSKKMLLVY